MRFNKVIRNLVLMAITQIASDSLLIADSLELRFASFKKALEEADSGDAVACYAVGMMYENGLNGPRDHKRALHYYRLAGDLGYPFALLKFGDLSNRIGSIIENADFEKRATSEIGAFLSNPEALNAAEMNIIADLYLNGTGTFAKSLPHATDWWKKAFNVGDQSAAYQLAITNLSIGRDETVRKGGMDSLCSLASQGHPLSIAVLNSVLYGNPPKLRPAWTFTNAEEVVIQDAVDAGLDELISGDYLNDFFKTFYVADFLWTGIGFDKDESNAIDTWKRSFELGNLRAADVLIAIYLGTMGDGRYLNLDDAKHYLEIRAEYGDSCSTAILSALATGVPPSSETLRPIDEALKSTFSGRK